MLTAPQSWILCISPSKSVFVYKGEFDEAELIFVHSEEKVCLCSRQKVYKSCLKL